MSLTYCEGCCQLEGKTEETEEGVVICAECKEEIIRVPEHDDYDLER